MSHPDPLSPVDPTKLTPSEQRKAITAWLWWLWLRDNAPMVVRLIRWSPVIVSFFGSVAWLSAEPTAPGAPLANHWIPLLDSILGLHIAVKIAVFAALLLAGASWLVIHHFRTISRENQEHAEKQAERQIDRMMEGFRQALREGLAPVGQLLGRLDERQDELERRQDESDARMLAQIEQLRKDAAVPGQAPPTGSTRNPGLDRRSPRLDLEDVDGLAPDPSHPGWAETRITVAGGRQ